MDNDVKRKYFKITLLNGSRSSSSHSGGQLEFGFVVFFASLFPSLFFTYIFLLVFLSVVVINIFGFFIGFSSYSIPLIGENPFNTQIKSSSVFFSLSNIPIYLSIYFGCYQMNMNQQFV